MYLFNNQVIIKDFLTLPSNSIESLLLHSAIVTPLTEGKTFILPEQCITSDSEIKIEKVESGKVFLPRLNIQVKMNLNEDETTNEQVYSPLLKINLNVSKTTKKQSFKKDMEEKYKSLENKYQLVEDEFAKIYHKIFNMFIEKLPNGRGVYYRFLTMTQSVDHSSIIFTHEIAMIWAEKIIRT